MSRKASAARAAKNYRCHYCREAMVSPLKANMTEDERRRMATRDHTTPRADGGRHVVWACNECNAIKGSAPYAVFLAFMFSEPPREGRAAAFRAFCATLMVEGLQARAATASVEDAECALL